MGKERKAGIENRIWMLSLGVIGLAVAFLVFVGVKELADTWIYPVGLGVFLAVYWLISDVVSVIWLKAFEKKRDEQKRAYLMFAGLEAVGFAGLAYFIVDLQSMTGVIVYAVCTVLKRRFREQYERDEAEEEAGVSKEADAAGEAAKEETGEHRRTDDKSAPGASKEVDGAGDAAREELRAETDDFGE